MALDYGQFYLHTGEHDPESAVTLLEQAQDGDGIAQGDGLLVIKSPHQNNFGMPLTVEVWDQEAADDLDDWQEAFEAHVVVSDFGLRYHSPTLDVVKLPVPPGAYRMQVAGRGFVAHGWPGSTTPGDEWRIRLWPASQPTAPRRLRHRNGDGLPSENAPVDRSGEGRAAEARISRDLQRAPGARVLSGRTAQVSINRTIAASVNVLFDACEYNAIDGWAFPHSDDDYELAIHAHGRVMAEQTARHEPHTLVYDWNWYLPGPLGGFTEPVLRRPTSLRIDLTQTDRSPDQASITITHSNLPAEWAEDMTAYWTWRLESLANFA